MANETGMVGDKFERGAVAPAVNRLRSGPGLCLFGSPILVSSLALDLSLLRLIDP